MCALGDDCFGAGHPPAVRGSRLFERIYSPKLTMRTLTAVRTVLIVAVTLAASPAAAQAPEVSFRAGRVTIAAREAPLAAVLDSWEQQGGSRFVGAGRFADQSVSVQLVDVPERDALRVLLRSAGGYVAIPRSIGQSGDSAFERIFIMAGDRQVRAARGAASATPESGPVGAIADGRGTLDRLPAAVTQETDPDALDDFDELDEMNELDLVESLRRRFQSAAPAAREAEPAGFRSQPDGGDLRSTPRPGMVIEAEEPQNRPNPVRRRNRQR